MGTRAAFWVGNPTDLENREWLGCIAWDGYPEGLPELANVKSKKEFREVVSEYAKRDDFASPEKGGWPYPWPDDIFVTDYNYAWFNDRVNYASFHSGWGDFKNRHPGEHLGNLEAVPADSEYDASQPDSIIIFSTRRR